MESASDTFAIITFSLGTLGFVYGLYATSQLHNISQKLEKLEEDLENLKPE